MEPRFNKPLYNEVLGITNDTPRPSNSKIYARCNKTSSQRKYFVSLFALGYIEVPVYNYFIFLSFALLYSIGFLPVVILNTRHRLFAERLNRLENTFKCIVLLPLLRVCPIFNQYQLSYI